MFPPCMGPREGCPLSLLSLLVLRHSSGCQASAPSDRTRRLHMLHKGGRPRPVLEHMLQPLRSLPDSLTPGSGAPPSHILGPDLCGLAGRHCGRRANADLEPSVPRRRLWNFTGWASINGVMSIGSHVFGSSRCAWDRTSCCLVADFHWVFLPPALILLPRARRPPSTWPLALDCLGRESPGSNSPSLPRLPCSHAEILHCRACADTAFCPLGGHLARSRDLPQRPQACPTILYGSRIPSQHAELLGRGPRPEFLPPRPHGLDLKLDASGYLRVQFSGNHPGELPPRAGRPPSSTGPTSSRCQKGARSPRTLDRSPSPLPWLPRPAIALTFRSCDPCRAVTAVTSPAVEAASGRPWPWPCRQQRLRRRRRGSARSFSSASGWPSGSCRPGRDRV